MVVLYRERGRFSIHGIHFSFDLGCPSAKYKHKLRPSAASASAPLFPQDTCWNACLPQTLLNELDVGESDSKKLILCIDQRTA